MKHFNKVCTALLSSGTYYDRDDRDVDSIDSDDRDELMNNMMIAMNDE